METLSLQAVLEATSGLLHGGGARSMRFERVRIDSRAVQPGDLFVALPGQRSDGHDYVAQAFASGAAAALVERVPPGYPWGDQRSPTEPPLVLVRDSLSALQALGRYWRLRRTAEVVAVTGSVGKTSTKEITACVLAHRYRVLASPGNFNTEIGIPLTLLDLQPDHEVAVLEMGMYAHGEISQLASIAAPRIGIVTNVQPSHLERLGSLEAIAQAKAELVEALPADGLAILNADDRRVLRMGQLAACEVWSYGLAADALVRASGVASSGLKGLELWLHWAGKKVHLKLPLLGAHSIHAALAAAAVALRKGMDLFEVAETLQRVSPSLRIAIVSGVSGSRLIDDTYNANPESTLAALNLLSELDGRKIAVLGDMLELGSYEELGHRKVGTRAAQLVQLLVGVGPRAKLVVEAAAASGLPRSSLFHTESNFEAAEYLLHVLRPGDNVLVKGSRGMQMEEIVQALRVES